MKKLILISLLAIFAGCKKPQDGATGATGPAGPAGSANVTTQFISTTAGVWSQDLSTNSWYTSYVIPSINSSVLQNGTVNVFLTDAAGNDFQAMPFCFQTVQFNYDYSLTTITIQVSLTTGAMPGNPGIQYFKIVSIPPQMKKLNQSEFL